MNENQEIQRRIIKKLSDSEYTYDELFDEHFHFCSKITDPYGTYVYYEKNQYYIVNQFFHGIESKQAFSDIEDFLFNVILEAINSYVQKTNGAKPDSQKIALQILKNIDEKYYSRALQNY